MFDSKEYLIVWPHLRHRIRLARPTAHAPSMLTSAFSRYLTPQGDESPFNLPLRLLRHYIVSTYKQTTARVRASSYIYIYNVYPPLTSSPFLAFSLRRSHALTTTPAMCHIVRACVPASPSMRNYFWRSSLSVIFRLRRILIITRSRKQIFLRPRVSP